MTGLVDDDEPGAELGEADVGAPLPPVAGADDGERPALHAHGCTHVASSTSAVGAPVRSPGRSIAVRMVGAALSASRRTLPSSRSTVLGTEVVTDALRGALSSSPRSPK